MKKIILLIGLFFIVCTFMAKADNMSIDEIVRNAENLAGKWDYKGAVDFYEEALKCNPGNFELLWRLAYNYIKLGLMTKKKEDKELLYEKAAFYAQKAIIANSERIEGHLWISVAQGRLALLKGGKTKVTLSKNVKLEAEKALEIDPNNDVALHVLGGWNREAATLPGILKMFAKIIYGGLPPSSKEDAVKYLEKAVAVNPKSIEHYLALGKCYMAMHNWDLAKKAWNRCLELNVIDAYDKNFQEEARELLSEYKNRK